MSASRRITKLALAAALVAVTGAAWAGYRHPAFLVHLANATWLCN
jgi:hypothetical protein